MKSLMHLAATIAAGLVTSLAIAGCAAPPESADTEQEEVAAAEEALDGAFLVIGDCGLFGSNDPLTPLVLVCTVEGNIEYPNEPDPPDVDLFCPPCSAGQTSVTCDVLDDNGEAYRRQVVKCPSSPPNTGRSVSAPPPHGTLPVGPSTWTVVPPDPCAAFTGFEYTCCKKPWTVGCFDY